MQFIAKVMLAALKKTSNIINTNRSLFALRLFTFSFETVTTLWHFQHGYPANEIRQRK
jgi:hypothetical protein